MNAPTIGDAGAGMVLVGPPTNPVLYVVTIVAIVVMAWAVLTWICQDVDRG